MQLEGEHVEHMLLIAVKHPSPASLHAMGPASGMCRVLWAHADAVTFLHTCRCIAAFKLGLFGVFGMLG